eukprot:4286813-Pleurochrysis_carterae.AAC.2
MVSRTVSLERAAHASGAEYVLEHPADRGALASPILLHKRHGSIWLTPHVIALKAEHNASRIIFSQ